MLYNIAFIYFLIACLLKCNDAFAPAKFPIVLRRGISPGRGVSYDQTNCKSRVRQGTVLRAEADQSGVGDVFEQCRQKLKGTCVYFVGMMGCGKSTLGDAFAKKMGYRFLDTDEIAEFMIDMPIADFFAQGKVDEFRQLEYQILMELAQYTRVAVSTGGGIVLKNENWGLLRHGIVVFVDMEPESIYARLKADPAQIAKRPLLRESDPLAKLKQLSEERMEKYMQADVHLKLSGESRTPDQLAEMTAQAILDFIANNPPLWEGWKKKRDSFAVEAAGRVSSVEW
jgi:shikimate kinase